MTKSKNVAEVAKPIAKAETKKPSAENLAIAKAAIARVKSEMPVPDRKNWKKSKVAKSAAKAETKKSKKDFGREGMPKFSDTAKIVVLAKGKENPRREGTGPHKRYAALVSCKTVGDFLKKLPKWRATINRAEREGFIRIG